MMAQHQSRRLSRLEEQHGPAQPFKPCHRVIGYSRPELDAQAAELIASGAADASDDFVYRLIVPAR